MNPHFVPALDSLAPAWFGFFSRKMPLCLAICWVCLAAGVTQVSAQNWGVAGSLSTARSLHTATPLANGKVLVVGGINVISPCCTNTGIAELYDPAAGQWSATGSPSTPRANHIAVRLHNGKVLIASGNGSPFSNILNSAEIYDPETGNWSAAGNLNVARQSPRATLLADGRVLVTGGLVVVGNTAVFSNTAEVYDPATNAWTPTAPMNSARVLHTVTLLPNGKVLAAGGSAAGFNTILQRTAELFDPATNAWTLTGELTTPRMTHTTTLLANGKTLLTGGATANGANIINNAELYDPATGQWTATGGMSTPRVLHTLTLLPNGKVLASGGASANTGGLSKSAELYDPATGSWTSTAELSAARQNHRATLLSNGKVLAIAGSGAGQLTSAELFDSGEAVATTVSAASYQTPIAAKEIVAAFGQNFSTVTAVASSIPLPTSLAGVTVRVRGQNEVERIAPLFFVSPGQVNYQVPDGTAPGTAFVTITASDGSAITGIIQVISAAPAIFTLNASGTGPAAAVDAFTGVAAPFNATRSSGEPNIISVFGTGVGADVTDVDGNVNPSVQATMDGNPITVQYAGRAPGFVGLNQLNLIFPAGVVPGTHTLVISRNGVASNPVTISIK
jgi:uncharacterized protein (TIGR03437 family)